MSIAITVEGTEHAGYWINVGPGINRIGSIYATRAAAEAAANPTKEAV